jgi:hypothetical protein
VRTGRTRLLPRYFVSIGEVEAVAAGCCGAAAKLPKNDAVFIDL